MSNKFGWLLIIVGIISASRLAINIVRLTKTGNLVTEARQELAQAQKDNEILKAKLTEVQSPDFIEKEAREKLGYAKEGETIVIIPDEKKSEPSFAKATEGQTAVWLKWWKLYIRI